MKNKFSAVGSYHQGVNKGLTTSTKSPLTKKARNAHIEGVLKRLLGVKKFSLTTIEENGLLTLTLQELPCKQTPRVSLSPQAERVPSDEGVDALLGSVGDDFFSTPLSVVEERVPTQQTQASFPPMAQPTPPSEDEESVCEVEAPSAVPSPIRSDRNNVPAQYQNIMGSCDTQPEDEAPVWDPLEFPLNEKGMPAFDDMRKFFSDEDCAIEFLVNRGVIPVPPTACPRCKGPLTMRKNTYLQRC